MKRREPGIIRHHRTRIDLQAAGRGFEVVVAVEIGVTWRPVEAVKQLS